MEVKLPYSEFQLKGSWYMACALLAPEETLWINLSAGKICLLESGLYSINLNNQLGNFFISKLLSGCAQTHVYSPILPCDDDYTCELTAHVMKTAYVD